MDALARAYPNTRHVMIGRGMLADPALAREIRGGAKLTLDELRQFHDKLFAAYRDDMGGNAVFRMKEWWSYATCNFAEPQKVVRAVRKARHVDDYLAAMERIWSMRSSM